MRRLLNYFEFLKESKFDPDIDIDKSEIEDIFDILIDEGYRLELKKHFTEYNNLPDIKNGDEPDEVELIRTDREYVNVFSLDIKTPRQTNVHLDVTEDLISGLDYIESKGFKLLGQNDESGKLFKNIDLPFTYQDINLVDGKIILFRSETNQKLDIDKLKADERMESVTEVIIYFSDMKKKKFTSKEIADEYDIHYDGYVDEFNYDLKTFKDVIYFNISRNDLADIVMNRNSWGKEYFSHDGIDILHDQHLHNDYWPDTDMLFKYELDDDNVKMLVKAIIEEHGGVNDIIDEYSIEIEVDGPTIDDLIDFLLNERDYQTLKMIDSEILDEVKRIVEGFERNSHVDEIYEEIMNEFDNLLDENNVPYIKKYQDNDHYFYHTKTADGEQVGKKVEYETVFYRIAYTDDYFDGLDRLNMDDIRGWSLEDIFCEYYSDNYLASDISIRDIYPGGYDKKEMNQEVRALLSE